MDRFDIFDTIESLRRKGDPFCVATVVRTADATSAKAGAKAAITRTGEIIGHLGGACVQRAVRQAVDEALSTGSPRIIRVKPSDKVVAMHDMDGTQVFKSGCPSGGTVDLLIEPHAHPPRLVIHGDTPIAHAIAAHGKLAGFRVCLPDTDNDRDRELPVIEARDFVIVASQGKGDLAALRVAIESRARRVAMVASRRKADVLMQKLVDAGVTESQVRRLKSPAGLDIKAVDPQEIAISVLAEIVLWRNTDTEAECGGASASDGAS